MKKLLLLLIAPVLGYGQGEQRYADGTATDQDGNTFEWINYGTKDWAIENVDVITYRDGTEIPQVTDNSEWAELTTGAWCYYDNDSTKGRLYNWYAVMGIHDTDPNTLNKEFAPEGWHVPTDAEWTELENHLIASGYNYDGTTTGNKIAKAMASTAGWNSSTNTGMPGYDQGINNTSGFNALAKGVRNSQGNFILEGNNAIFRSSTEENSETAWNRNLLYNVSYIYRKNGFKQGGISIRFVRDASTASRANYSNAITIYPNPTTSILTIQGNKHYQIKVYDLLGNKVLETQGNSVNMERLSSATYIVKALDKVENEEVSYKVVKN